MKRMGCITGMLVVLLLIGLSSAAFAGAGQEATDDKEISLRITMWSSNESHLKMFNAMAEEYRKTHPNVKVAFEPIPFGDYISKLTIQLAGSNPPDAGWIVDQAAPSFIDAGVLNNLKPVLAANKEFDLNDFSAGPMSLWVKGDAIFGVPFSTSPYLIFYNKDLFAKAGVDTPDRLIAQGKWNMESFRSAAKAIAQAAGKGVYGFESYDGQVYGVRLWNTMGMFLNSFGGKFWNDAGTECTVNKPPAVAAFQFVHDMTFKDKSHVPPGEIGDFFTGLAGMCLAQISRTAKLKDAPFKWDIAPIPVGPAGDKQSTGQAAFAAFKSGRNPGAAADLIASLTNKSNVLTMAQYFPPARNSVLASKEFLSSNPLLSAASMALVGHCISLGTVEAVHVNFPKIDIAIHGELDKVWKADADVQAVLNATYKVLQPLMK